MGRGRRFDFSGLELQHKSVVEPVFLAYNRVSAEGPRPLLMQIVTAVVETLDDVQAVDAVQPMKSGWWIYLQTALDREHLVSGGITLGRKHIPLQSEFRPQCQTSVKITIKDLQLHIVDNSQVLNALSEICEVTSEVFYGTLWHDGKATSICNGDRYCYVPHVAAAKLPDVLIVADMEAQILKPKALLHVRDAAMLGILQVTRPVQLKCLWK